MKKLSTTFILFLFAYICFTQTWSPEEEIIGNTFYDVQTTRSMQNRIYLYEDETIGAVFNFGFNWPSYPDLAVGYNYYNGNFWGPYPTQSITSGTAKNPSYTKFGENGEIVVSEGENGLYINYRMTKGQGDWEEVIFQGPAGFEKLFSPQIVTTGTYNEVIHLLALRKDESIQFEDDYQDNTGQVLYSRSADYGTTWDILHHEFDFNEDYFGFSELSLVWAEPKNNTLAFMVGDYYTDLILLKSTDGGDNWQKTIVWEHPIAYFEHNVTLLDTFWANTGSQSLSFDFDSKVHLTFSLTCIFSDTIDWTDNYDWWADGIVYWNEDRPAYSNNPNALCPYWNCTNSELEEDYSLIGWSYWGLNFTWATPYWNIYPSLGISTMPTVVIYDNSHINIVWSSITETYDNGTANYRHLWTRSSFDGGDTWGDFNDLTSDLIHIFDECVFPVYSANHNIEYAHLIYQSDNEPGLYIDNGGPMPSENYIRYMKIENDNPNFILIDFYAYQDTIHEGESVQFWNNTTGFPSPITYHWYFEGGTPQTSSSLHPYITYFTQGVYDVKLIASNDLITDSVIMEDLITVLPETKIKKTNEQEKINIYPNPSTGKFVIKLPYLIETEIKVFDLKGEMLFQQMISLNNEVIEIDLSGHAKGVYYLKINSDKISTTKKVLIK